MKPTKPLNTSSNSTPFDLITDLLQIIFDLLSDITIRLCSDLVDLLLRKVFKFKVENRVVTKKGLESKKSSTKNEHLGYSVNKKRPFPFTDLDTKRHALIIGASGWGKSNLIQILQENDLINNRPIIFFDPKGSFEAINQFKFLMNKYERKFHVFSEYHNPKSSISFNPLKNLDQTQATNLVMRSFDWDEPYYKARSEFALYKAIDYLKIRKQIISFQNIYAFLNEKVDKKDKKDILGLLAHLSRIVNSTFSKLFIDNGDALTLKDIREKKESLYIGLSTQGHGDLAKSIGKIFLCELLAHSYDVSTRPKNNLTPISVYFDELGSIIVPDFIDLINKCRSSGIELTSAIQNLADLDAINLTIKRQVFENCNNIFIQKQATNEDAQFLTKALGTFDTVKRTHMTLEDEKGDKGSVREVQEYFCHPNRLSEIRIGQCVLLRHNPKNIDLINIRLAKESK